MKCLRCGTENNLKDRTANLGRCSRCQHQFVFEPTSMGNLKITDTLFAKTIEAISANDSLFFTPRQLFYLLDKRSRKKSFISGAWIFLYLFLNVWTPLFIGGILLSVFPGADFLPIAISIIVNFCFIFQLFNNTKSPQLNSQQRQASARLLQVIGVIILIAGSYFSLAIVNNFIVFAISVILGMSSIYLGTVQRRRTNQISNEFVLQSGEFTGWLGRWSQINGTIALMLPSPTEPRLPPQINSDVTDYSFERLIVCDSAKIAQLLIANNFHFENNCAILSVTGYPQNIFDTVMEMVRRNQDLKVYVLHDFSPKGVGLVHHLRTDSNWFENTNITIYDLGLLPRQLFSSQDVFVQTSNQLARNAKELPLEVRASLTTEELNWLDAGKFVELESFTPKKLLQVVTFGIAQSRNLSGNDSLVPIDNDLDHSSVMIFTSESFG
ncbi:MAG: hypothetical protein WBB28_05240 [Crinalium sp.]